MIYKFKSGNRDIEFETSKDDEDINIRITDWTDFDNPAELSYTISKEEMKELMEKVNG